MMSKQPPKPMSTAGRVFMWVLFAFVLLLTFGIGFSLIAEGVDGRRTLEEGPVGTFTPATRDSCEEDCALIGEFTGADGTVTEQDVELKGERIERSDPMPETIDDVRLDVEAERPTAYTADFGWHWSVVKGGVVMVVGSAIVAFQLVMLRRHRSESR